MSHWVWRVLAFLITVAVTAGVALWIYKKQSDKALSYHVVSISPLGPLQARGFSDLRLLKGDKHIERPFLTTIRIANTGDLDIRASDFDVPLTIRPVGFRFPGVNIKDLKDSSPLYAFSKFDIPYKGVAQFAPQLVDARVAATTPPKIPVELVMTAPQLQIKPLLLNVGDELTVEVLINGDVFGIEVGGRIAGIKEIAQDPKPGAEYEGQIFWSRFFMWLSAAFGIVVLFVVAYIVFFTKAKAPPSAPN